ncbi:FxSxx-COOH system tetratricopeptide repeat protein [Kitasatospora camelliae]|uniref:FxSxx-COOH system tetratricopeptide repeat protein n=1 Tax=Kitasatospora camelliae TaxID=3156397 RepID=A0AAU8JYE4_9ACTN
MTSPYYEAAGTGAVAAQNIGTAITGPVTGLPAEILTAARDVPAPPSLTNLPPYPLCLGRKDTIAWLRDTLAENSGTAITQVSTVHGLGGIGKTTLALAYAHRHRRDYNLIWWINADSPTRLEQSLADLALRLLPAWAGKASQGEQAAWAMAWLQWHPGWLLVFDNVENPADLDRYLGALDCGHHLITSRRTAGWSRTIRTYPLGTLDLDEAAELICTHAFTDGTPTARELQDARALAADLGHLPLALEQAGAYLRQNPTISIDAYRRRLATKLDKAADGIDAERTIARIWTQTLHALTTRNPHAVEILRTLAWLAPDNIPIALLETPDDDNDDLHEALGLLGAYSMATVTRHTVSVHRLLQAVLRSTAPAEPDGVPTGRHAAEEALLRAIGPRPLPETGSAATWDALMPQLIALATTRPTGHNNDRAAGLYSTAAQHLHMQGHEARAIPLQRAAVAQCEQVLGDTHPDTLASRNNLAYTYRAAGDLARAIPLFETTLTQYEQVLGDTHPDTLTGRGNLAGAYLEAGDLARAIPLFETTLTQYEQVLGDTHPDTLSSRGNLAGAYQAAGNLTRAIPLLETTLTQREQVLGDTHPNTLTSRGNLASAYQEAGDLARAIPLYETNLTQREQVLGDTHPNTLTSRGNLAGAYRAAGSLARAIPLFETTLTQREQVLGDTHPDTLSSRGNLAGAYRAAGSLARAIPLFETTLAQREQVLGDTHPDTLGSRNNLAGAYQEAGDLTRAIPLYETNLTQCEQVLGDTHPNTLTSRGNLAGAYRAAGNLTRAIPLFETTLAQREQVLGDTHPDTLTSRNNLASAYQEAGDLTRAIPLFETTLAQCEQVLGDTHPDTLSSRGNLAGAYRAAGDLTRAIPLLETTLTQCEQVLGDTHPDTLTSRGNLASAYRAAGNLTRAIPLLETTLTQREQVLGDTHPDTLAVRANLAHARDSQQ